MKKFLCLVMAMLMFVFCFCSCGDEYKPAGNGGTTEAMSDKQVDKTIDHKSFENDDNIGLMSIKINTTKNYKLNDTEKLLVQYFDSDYEHNVEYNALQRYPQIYNNTQISFIAKVKKLIETSDESYTAMVQYGWYSSANDNDTDYVVIKGKQGTARLIEGDYILVYGKYTGVDSYTVDGTGYSLPTIEVNRFQFGGDNNGGEGFKDLYSVSDIKEICRYVFGDNITIRELNNEDTFDYMGSMHPYVCVLDNQSNANFSKYILDAESGHMFQDMNSENMANQSGIIIDLIFAADFEHFYVKRLDKNLDTFTLQCYDKELNKIWSRDFEETTSVVMDYTPDHIYVVANSSMYIIDAETGENATNPTYVGIKHYIRKLSDGILLIQGDSKSDAIMKTDIKGNVKWTANAKFAIDEHDCSIQISDENYKIFYSGTDENNNYSENVMVLDKDGTVIYDAESF